MRYDNDNAPAIVANSGALTFISMFSGIDAASVAFGPLGWRALAFSEIDKAASRVLAYHYPDVPNVGDMSKHDWSQYRGKVDIVCGGPPCQAFSVAGLRDGLNDARGNLSLEYMKALHAIEPRNAIVENVPGWLTMADNAFGCFLAGLVGAADPFVPTERKPANGKSTRWWRWAAKEKCHAVRWPQYGMVAGPKGRAAWAVKDAQYFGLAQRRERVLVVADFGAGADPAAVLFERVGVPWNPPARGEAGEGSTPATAPSLTASGRGVERTGESRGQDPVVAVGYHESGQGWWREGLGGLRSEPGGMPENIVAYAPEIARCVATREGSSQDFESTTMVAHAIQAGALRTNPDSGPDGVGVKSEQAYTLEARSEVQAVCVTGAVTHTLTTEGADASEDGTGRGTPIVAFNPRATDANVYGDQTGALDASYPGPAICFTAKDYGADAQVEQSPTLRAGGHDKSHQNGGVTPAVITYALNSHAGCADGEVTNKSHKAGGPAGFGLSEEVAYSLRAGRTQSVAQTVALRGREGGATAELGGEVATALRASSGGGDKPHVLTGRIGGSYADAVPVHPMSAVRRLTPRECERLQGFQFLVAPDYPGAWQDDAGRWWSPDYTRIPVKWYATRKVTKNRPEDMWEPAEDGGWWLMAADGPRYKQLGNSWAVPKFRWLGERIAKHMPLAANDNTNKDAGLAA